jgi:hypothetical protein
LHGVLKKLALQFTHKNQQLVHCFSGSIEQNKMNVADEIKKLKELYVSGVLTKEEYESQKQKLLDKQWKRITRKGFRLYGCLKNCLSAFIRMLLKDNQITTFSKAHIAES